MALTDTNMDYTLGISLNQNYLLKKAVNCCKGPFTNHYSGTTHRNAAFCIDSSIDL